MKKIKISIWKKLTISLFFINLLALTITGCGKLKTEIVHTAYLRNTEDSTGPYRIMVLVVSDSQPLEVSVVYSANNWKKASQIQMKKISDDIYVGELPGQPPGTTIKYFILVKDGDGEITTDPITIKEKISGNNFTNLKDKTGCRGDNPTYCFQILKKR